MKKLTRTQKSRLCEWAKTVTIVLLFFSCLFLCVKVFEIYRDQTVAGEQGGGVYLAAQTGVSDDNNDINTMKLFSRLSAPEMIVVNNVQSRMVVGEDTPEFLMAADAVNSAVSELYLMDSDEVEESDKTQWQSALGANSLYVRYPALRSTAYEADFYGADESALPAKLDSYKEMVFVPGGDGQSVTVIAPDAKRDAYVKGMISGAAATALNEMVKKGFENEDRAYAFAYELNLDTQNAAGKVTLDPMILLPTAAEKSFAEIVADVPGIYKASMEGVRQTDFTRGLVNAFGYNPNTIRQYVNGDGTLIFVGETGTLSVHPDGLIDYRALAAGDGIMLSASADNDAYGVMSGLCRMIDRIMRLSEINPEDCDFVFKLTHMPDNAQDPGQEIGFDYFVDGRMVEFEGAPAVKAVVEDGVLTEFAMQVKTIKKVENWGEVAGVFDAIDSFCEVNPQSTAVTSANVIYRYSGNGKETKAEWKIQGEQ